MPADTRNRRAASENLKNIYGRDRLYSNSNAAYDLPAYYPEQAPPKRKSESAPQTAKKRTAAVSNRSMRRMITIVMAVFVAAAVILCRYISIMNGNREISRLEKQYAQLVSENQAMQVKINGAIENGEIEKKAREELGMMAPESYQVFYIDMDMPDGGIGGSMAEETEDAVLGTPGTLMNAFRVLK